MADNIHNIKNFYQMVGMNTPLLLEYQFLVTIIAGQGMGEVYGMTNDDFKRIQLFCQSASIPEKRINTATVNYFGKNFSVPTTEQPQHEWQTSIILTNDMTSYNQLRKLILRFSNLEQNMGGIRTIPNIDIVVDVLNQFSEIDDSQPRIVLKGCYPRTLDTINLAYQDNADVIRPNVTWIYQYSFFTNPGVDRNDFDSLNPGNVAPVAR